MNGDGPPSPDDGDRKIAALDQSFFQASTLIRLESISNFAQSLWKGLMLVNGGAIVALFTLIGSTNQAVDRSWLWWAFFIFAAGIGSTLISNLTAYVTQSAFMQQDMSGAWNAQEQMHGRPPKWIKDVERSSVYGTVFEWIALGSATVSLIAFLAGSWCALNAVIPTVKSYSQTVHPRPMRVPPPDRHLVPRPSPPDRKPLSAPPSRQSDQSNAPCLVSGSPQDRCQK